MNSDAKFIFWCKHSTPTIWDRPWSLVFYPKKKKNWSLVNAQRSRRSILSSSTTKTRKHLIYCLTLSNYISSSISTFRWHIFLSLLFILIVVLRQKKFCDIDSWVHLISLETLWHKFLSLCVTLCIQCIWLQINLHVKDHSPKYSRNISY